MVKPLIPPAENGGNKRAVIEREIVNGLMYTQSTGCQWVFIPKGLPPRCTLNGCFRRWDYSGTLDRIHAALHVRCRDQAERAPSPSAAIIDSQSVRNAKTEGLDRSGGHPGP